MNDVHFSSGSVEWETPQQTFDELDAEFHFTLDPCATDNNHKCVLYYTREDDGLSKSWVGEVVFMNPPYGKEIKHWVEKAFTEWAKGAVVVCLIPARTDTAYWHDFIFPCAEVRFVRNRLYFKRSDGTGGRAPFPSAIVIFK